MSHEPHRNTRIRELERRVDALEAMVRALVADLHGLGNAHNGLVQSLARVRGELAASPELPTA